MDFTCKTDEDVVMESSGQRSSVSAGDRISEVVVSTNNNKVLTFGVDRILASDHHHTPRRDVTSEVFVIPTSNQDTISSTQGYKNTAAAQNQMIKRLIRPHAIRITESSLSVRGKRRKMSVNYLG